MRRVSITAAFVFAASLWSFADLAASDVPLPDINTIKQRALDRLHKDALELERYSCDVVSKEQLLKSDGSVKETTTKEYQRFFVNGQEVDHLLKKNGVLLEGKAAEKEQAHVDKQVREDMDAKRLSKTERDEIKQIDSFLRALRFTNGHRESRQGRSIVVYDLAGDPDSKASDLTGRFAHALSGRIWIDELTGAPVEIDLHTDRNVRVLAGVGSVHKGFRLHVVEQMVGEETWIDKALDARGDARALFATVRFNMSQSISGCRLYHVDAQSAVNKPAPK